MGGEFRLRGLSIWTEALASLEWPADWLVSRGYVADDSPREMAPPPAPTRRIARQDSGVPIAVERVAA